MPALGGKPPPPLSGAVVVALGCWGPFPRVGQAVASHSSAGRAGSGVEQTQERGHRVPSGPFKGTFDLNHGAR